jgi:glutaredoxin-related protein
MFNNALESYKKIIAASMPQNGNYVYLRDILQDDSIKKHVKQFADAEVEWWIYYEQVKRRDNPRYDLAIPDILTHFHTLDNYCKAQARFDSLDQANLIDSCIDSYINFLCRPRTALRSFIFRGEPTKSVHEILLRFSACSVYTYLEEGFKIWVDNNCELHLSEHIITAKEFKSIITDIDNEYIRFLQAQGFIDLLEPLFQFFIDIYQSDKSIPAEALIVFLQDKELFPLASKIEELYQSKGIKQYNSDSLAEMISSLISEYESHSISQSSNQTAELQTLADNTKQDIELEVLYHKSMDASTNSVILISRHNFITKSHPSLYTSTDPIRNHNAENINIFSDSTPLLDIDTPTNANGLQKSIPTLLEQHGTLQNDESFSYPITYRSSFLGSMPIDKQLYYASKACKGNLKILRKLGQAIDKTSTKEAAILTLTAFSEVYNDYEDMLQCEELRQSIVDFSNRNN